MSVTDKSGTSERRVFPPDRCGFSFGKILVVRGLTGPGSLKPHPTRCALFVTYPKFREAHQPKASRENPPAAIVGDRRGDPLILIVMFADPCRRFAPTMAEPEAGEHSMLR
ncbi:MAG: hypothetical protein EXS11_09355 [Gemmataceae bacterium]|nr:hypothetical protein [Gemmataceae bacterium]